MNGLIEVQEDVLEAAVKANSPMSLFTETGALQPLLEAIREASLAGYAPDLTTDRGRKAIASAAAKVAKAKVRLDGIGKDLVAELKELPKTIDANRKVARDYLEGLQAELRQPLTDWEAAEAAKEQEARQAAEQAIKEREEARERELAELRQKVEAQERAERERAAREAQEARERQIAADAADKAMRDAQARIDAAERAAEEAKRQTLKAEEERERREAERVTVSGDTKMPEVIIPPEASQLQKTFARVEAIEEIMGELWVNRLQADQILDAVIAGKFKHIRWVE